MQIGRRIARPPMTGRGRRLQRSEATRRSEKDCRIEEGSLERSGAVGGRVEDCRLEEESLERSGVTRRSAKDRQKGRKIVGALWDQKKGRKRTV